jgi:hypothetical protein
MPPARGAPEFPFGAGLVAGLMVFGYALTSQPAPPVEYAGLVAL